VAKLGYEFEGSSVEIATRLPRQLGRPRGGRFGYRYLARAEIWQVCDRFVAPGGLAVSIETAIAIPAVRFAGLTENQLLERRQGPPVPFLE